MAILWLSGIFITGCATYVTPGSRAELDAFAPMSIREGFERQPTSPFPASILAVRLQGGGYTNHNLGRTGGVYGGRGYSVVLTREVEEEEDFQRIRDLPKIDNVISLNRMLVPDKLESIDDLRVAASRLRADLLLVYTFDTRFFREDRSKPLTTFSLGLAPTRKVTATTTASALLVDTRTGFIYGAIESTEVSDRNSTSWGTREVADKARVKNERTAFNSLIDAFEAVWGGILAQHGGDASQ